MSGGRKGSGTHRGAGGANSLLPTLEAGFIAGARASFTYSGGALAQVPHPLLLPSFRAGDPHPLGAQLPPAQ